MIILNPAIGLVAILLTMRDLYYNYDPEFNVRREFVAGFVAGRAKICVYLSPSL